MEGCWLSEPGITLPLFHNDLTDMEKLVITLNIASQESYARELSNFLEQNFNWSKIKTGIPFEGSINLSHDKYYYDDYTELTNIPALIRIDPGPYVNIEFLIRK